MLRRFAALSGAVAVICACSLASVPAFSVPSAPGLQADTNVTFIKKGGGGGKHGGNKNWSKKGGKDKWSGGKNWSKHGKWHAGQRNRGYWRGGIFLSLPFVVGDQCYDYLDWSEGVRPGWYWVC
jgi:hypothetical protein